MKIPRILSCFALCLWTLGANAEGWCDLAAGSYDLVSHGTVSDKFYLIGQLPGAPSAVWMTIADNTVGKGNVALILAAQMAGKGVSVYIDSPSYTCASFPNWAPIGAIRHIRVLQ
jgi:hypothetical protein